MIIPHRHAANLTTLNKRVSKNSTNLLKRAFTAISKAYGPGGMMLGMNLGRVGGAGVLGHLHYRYSRGGTATRIFMPIVAQTKVVSEGLEQTYKKLVALFS